MKWVIVIGMLFLLPAFGIKHPYYFGFAEMQYLKEQKRLEVSLSLSSHDSEELWLKKGVLQQTWSKTEDNEQTRKALTTAISKGFQVSCDKQNVLWQLDGWEIHRNGLIYFYLHADQVEAKSAFEITFDLLMESYPEQQNKITFLTGGEKQTAVFLKNKTTQILKP